jgi:hypothetical protein
MSSLTGEFAFSTARVATPEEIAAQVLWDSVKTTRDPLQIMLYQRGDPDSPLAAEARALLNETLAVELAPGAPAAPLSVAPAVPAGPDPREAEMIGVAQRTGSAADCEAHLAEYPQGLYPELARIELAALAAKAAAAARVARAVPAPTPKAVAPAPAIVVTFAGVPTGGGAEIDGRSIAELVESQPLFPPIAGLPDSVRKDQTCAPCHNWTQAAPCDQARTDLAGDLERALSKPHPLGEGFKRSLRQWAEGRCN